MPEGEAGFERLSDEVLVGLLTAEQGRLPREAVNEFIRRGARIVPALAAILRDEGAWLPEDDRWTSRPVHATYILARASARYGAHPD